MTEPVPQEQQQTPLLARRVGPFPVWVWFIVLVLALALFLWWRKRKAGDDSSSSMANSNISGVPVVDMGGGSSVYPMFPSELLVRIDRGEPGGQNQPEDPDRPVPANPGAPSATNQVRWFGAIVPVTYYTSIPGDTWTKVHDKFGMTKGAWNLFLFNTSKESQTQDQYQKPIPTGTRIMIPTTNK